MRVPKTIRYFVPLLATLTALVVAAPAVAMGATVPLGTTAPFAVLAGATITNTGPTTITGDVGLSPGSSFVDTGVTLNGTRHIADAVADQAQTDLTTAYNDAAGRTPILLGGVELGGRTLTPGVYSSGGVLEITGTLTLDAQGDPEAVFIFQSTATLVTAANSVVRLVNGARFCRVFWVVPSAATLGTDSIFKGHIFAVSGIQAYKGANIEGQLLVQRAGAVTLENNVITNIPCASVRAIHVTKTASRTTLTGSGSVTYTYRVTNPGTYVLDAITVTDDKVSPVVYQSGDTNGDNRLQPGEIWIYTATTNIDVTTTNTGTASGTQGGVTVTGTATAKVVVRTGGSSSGTVTGGNIPKTSTPLYDVLLLGVALMFFGVVGLGIRKRRA
jgi:Ice-binding-like